MAEQFPQDNPSNDAEIAKQAHLAEDQLSAEAALQAQQLQAELAANAELEQLRVGAHLLVGNVSLIAHDEDPAAVKQYLTDVLKDEDGTAPAEERKVVFELLASEQKKTLSERILGAGETMVASLEKGDADSRHDMKTAHINVQSTFNRLPEIHRSTVGAAARRGDPSAVINVHHNFKRAANQAENATVAHTGAIQKWEQNQRQVAEAFFQVDGHANGAKYSVEQARAQIDPGYDGKPKDIANVFEDDVVATVADRLVQSGVEGDSGKAAQEVVATLLDAEPDASEEYINASLRNFAGGYADFASRTKLQAEAQAEDATYAMKRFMNNGEQAYGHVRDEYGMQEAYKTQSRSLASAAEEALAVSRFANAQYGQSMGQIQSLKHGLRAERARREAQQQPA